MSASDSSISHEPITALLTTMPIKITKHSVPLQTSSTWNNSVVTRTIP